MGYIYQTVDTADGATTDDKRCIAVGRKVRLVGVILTSFLAAARHSANWKKFQVLQSDEVAVAWEWSLDADDSDVALAAKTTYGFAPDGFSVDVAKAAVGTGATLEYDGNQTIVVRCLHDNSGVATQARMTLILEPVS